MRRYYLSCHVKLSRGVSFRFIAYKYRHFSLEKSPSFQRVSIIQQMLIIYICTTLVFVCFAFSNFFATSTMLLPPFENLKPHTCWLFSRVLRRTWLFLKPLFDWKAPSHIKRCDIIHFLTYGILIASLCLTVSEHNRLTCILRLLSVFICWIARVV